MEGISRYPVQPFVFEFSKEASKHINFNDIHIKPPPSVDMTPVINYLEKNGNFLREFSSFSDTKNEPTFSASLTLEQINKVFFREDFDIRKKEIFKEVFPEGCMKHKLFGEQLLVQLDTVQSLLFHSSDNNALEFFKSFSTIHDIHNEVANLLPKVKDMRQDLKHLEDISSVPSQIINLRQTRERLVKLKSVLLSVQKITNAASAAISLADVEQYTEAFAVIDEHIEFLNKGFGAVKSLNSCSKKLLNTREEISNRLKNAFYKVIIGESKEMDSIITALYKNNILTEAVSSAVEYIKDYSRELVSRIIQESFESRESGKKDLDSLTVREFANVLNYASPNIRNRIIEKISHSVNSIVSQLQKRNINTESFKDITQEVADTVFKKIASLVTKHPLNDAEIDDFNLMFDALVSFGRAFESHTLDKSVIQTAINEFGKSFVESFDCSQTKRIALSICEEKWSKANPTPIQLEILKKLTTGKDLDCLEINEEKYKCTSSLLVLLEIIWSYLTAARKIKSTSDDIIVKLSEMINNYGTNIMDMLYNGGAVKSGKLKNITTKHLALAASNIKFLGKLISYIKARLYATISDPQIITQNMDKVVSNFNIYLREILEKIVNILAVVMSGHVNVAEVSTSQTSQYVVNISKEFMILYNIVSDILPADTAQMVINEIIQNVITLFDNLYKSNATKKTELSRDLKAFNESISATNSVVRVPSLL